MYRDFSESSKNKLLGLVSDVESEKWCDFTDWVGDRWLDFESWIGSLNIKSYVSNVNSYHKKVIDKNNATKKSIEDIFSKVASVDKSYDGILHNILDSLEQWKNYIEQLSEITTPSNGSFNAQYMSEKLKNLLSGIDAQNIKCLRDRMVQDIDGELVFNEELIKEYILKEYYSLSESEKELLAEIISLKEEYQKSFEGENVSVVDNFIEEFKANYGLENLLAGSGYIGDIYGFIRDFKSSKNWNDYAKTGVEVFQFLSGALTTWGNYTKIGNAVGIKTARTWWLKNITGIKPLGRSSTASTWWKRFSNNLTNKTSPFNAQLRNVVKDFTGGNGVGRAVSTWASVAVDGVVNFFDNKEEQKLSNGEMSDGRVVAETITETAIDTALTYGAGIAVGAAVAACTTVALPGVVVTAAAGLLVAGVNAGVKALTGKSTTEWASDAILDAGEAVVNTVGKAAKKVSNAIGDAANGVKNAVGGWFKKLKFA